jgi:hypothetical protein
MVAREETQHNSSPVLTAGVKSSLASWLKVASLVGCLEVWRWFSGVLGGGRDEQWLASRGARHSTRDTRQRPNKRNLLKDNPRLSERCRMCLAKGPSVAV